MLRLPTTTTRPTSNTAALSTSSPFRRHNTDRNRNSSVVGLARQQRGGVVPRASSDGGSSSSDDLVPVEFRVEKQVPYGEHLVITGSSNFMGGWDITQVRACIGTSLRGVECLGV